MNPPDAAQSELEEEGAETIDVPVEIDGGRRFAPIISNEAFTDFSVDEHRRSMAAAMDEVAAQLGGDYPLVIGGKRVNSKKTFASLSPSHKIRAVGNIALADRADADQAVNAAREAQREWAGMGAKRRGEHLMRAAAEMRRRRLELAAWEAHECGKNWAEADADVCEAADFFEYYSIMAARLEEERGVDVPGEENRFEYFPIGVVAVISPWNFPLAILNGMTTGALAAGNAVVIKPASTASVVGAKLMEIFESAGLPPGVLNYVPGSGSVVGNALVEHPKVGLIAFTGSREVGLSINVRAAEVSASGLQFVKRVIAEMGGKNAIIVDEDADLDEAVLGVRKSAFGYQGQKCSACSRVIVLDGVYDTFLERLAEATASLRIGPAEEADSDMGPVIDSAALGKIHEYIDLGRKEAREVLAMDVGSLADEGFFVGPHIFADVPPNARIAQEEIFGPVLSVLRASDMDEAMSIANGTDYALTGGIYSHSPANLDKARKEFMVGNLYLNRHITGALVCRQPFGGFKLSGVGSKAGGEDYLHQFVLPRTITENTARRGFAPLHEDDGNGEKYR